MWKQRWFDALSVVEEFASRRDELQTSTGRPATWPERHRSCVRVGPGKSPYTPDELLSKGGSDLAAFLRTFRTKDAWDGPTLDGLAEALRSAVKMNPARFASKLADLAVGMRITFFGHTERLGMPEVTMTGMMF
jgi:hypothetical protein